MAIRVLEIDEERISKERPPYVSPVPAGKCGDVLVEVLPRMARFMIFGRKKTLHPRSVSLMSRIESLNVVDNILGPGQREERKLLPLGSDHPEEIARYWNYAKLAKGKVLVYRLGFGLFVRMAVHAKEITVVEPDPSIRSLIWPSVMEAPSSKCSLVPGDMTVFSQAAGKYDFIFIDPVLYTGKSIGSMTTIEQIPDLNRMIIGIKKLVAPGGAVAVRGYRDLISLYQQRCQMLVGEFRATMAFDLLGEAPKRGRMDELFYLWARKNTKRVLEKMDYKFINAWARNTALTVT